MHNKKISLYLFTIGLITSAVLTGCGKEKAVSSEKPSYTYQENQDIPVIPLPDDLTTPSENTIPVMLTFVNMCNTDIGLFSMIDPNNGEQINLSSLKNQGTLSIEVNWPKDNLNFQWALYNADGELCVEATTDLTGIEESAIIVVSGDGNVDNIDVTLN